MRPLDRAPGLEFSIQLNRPLVLGGYMRKRTGVFVLALSCSMTAPISSWSQVLSAQASHQSDAQPHPGPGSVRVQLPLQIADHEQILAYWTTETGWKSELQLRNNLAAQELTVTPALRLPDGSETTLSAVIVKPQEVKSVDLETEIAAVRAPQLVGTYGSIALRYQSLSSANLYAAMMIRRTGHPVAFHIDGMAESEDFQVGGREGVWWLPNDTASDYLILTNQGGKVLPLTLSLFDAVGRENKQKVLLGPREVARYSVRKLLQAGNSAVPTAVSKSPRRHTLDRWTLCTFCLMRKPNFPRS